MILTCHSLAGCSTIEVPLGSIFGNPQQTKSTSTFEPVIAVPTDNVSSKPIQPIGSQQQFSDQDDITGSISKPLSVHFTESDWNAALPLIKERLNTDSTSQIANVWLNPETGAFGSITTRSSDKAIGHCKSFYISLAHSQGQDWYKGNACKSSIQKDWEITAIDSSPAP